MGLPARIEDIAQVEARLAPERLTVLGGFHPAEDDGAPPGCGTLLLIGPAPAGFWPHVTAAPEFADGLPDPLDRWSRRVIGRLACDLGAKARFPFGGPPYAPFLSWALKTGRCWSSPVGLLVHDTAGLMVSFRGALALGPRLPLPAPPAQSPCIGCAAPCRAACPVSALTAAGYDTAACHAHLDTPAGRADCRDGGCAVRRACPVSRGAGRSRAQSAFHMRSFHP
jgi:ferredoxin